MSLERAKTHLSQYSADNRVIEFNVSSATVELAAKALSCTAGMIAKTLSFNVNEKPILIVVAGDYKIDNSKFKQIFMTKPKMLSPDIVEEAIGHAIGGVCPFGVNEGVDIYLDKSLKEHEIIYPACGSSNSAIKLTIEELEQFSQSKGWIDVTKQIETNI
ncbi:MAG: YbaK/EbsC family protein [Clostridiales bacterium]|nr:YbaK/EbsC family protein [Clostridiales bacterium]